LGAFLAGILSSPFLGDAWSAMKVFRSKEGDQIPQMEVFDRMEVEKL
jgi:hypothetical protein